MNAHSVALIGAALGEGARDPRTGSGPGSLRQWGLARRVSTPALPARWAAMVRSDPALLPHGAMAVVAEFAPRLAAAVTQALASGRCPVVLGGDHSCAVGTWSAVAVALRARHAAACARRVASVDAPSEARLGLIWIDAHLDAHTPATSESQRPHGMPLAALLGCGDPALTQVCDAAPKVRPEHLVLIGPRSWESGEAELLARLGVRVMPASEVAQRGLPACLLEARARVAMGTTAWGLSFDLDALDPQDAPGTGVPVADGLRCDAVVAALKGLASDPHFIACELVEYNPALDRDRLTAHAAARILGALLSPLPPAA